MSLFVLQSQIYSKSLIILGIRYEFHYNKKLIKLGNVRDFEVSLEQWFLTFSALWTPKS